MNIGNVRWFQLLSLILTGFFIAGCDGSTGATGSTGPAGPAGSTGPAGPPGQPPSDAIVIGDGSALTAEEIATLGKLTATITGVTVSSPPVVDFTVSDANGDPAVGIASGYVWFTFAKLVPNIDQTVNGGLPYWQSYINTVENVASNPPGMGSDVLDQAVQATNDSRFSGGSHVEVAPGEYQYTFGNDVTNITAPIAVAWEPNLTHRVGLEIRLDGEGEVPLAPFNPVFDFVPDGGAGSGITKDIAATNSCAGCHLEFTMHGGPRKSVEYCVTCHNPGSVDQDSGNSLDLAHLAHSIHMGEDRAVPFKIWGFGNFEHDFSEVTYPQAKTYCETCHTAAISDDGDAWNEGATAKACGGCHADGLLAENFDPVTGQAEYLFDHIAAGADVPIGTVEDGQCMSCHLGTISTAGPPLAIHSNIRGDQRARAEAGDKFVFEILSATNAVPGKSPTVKIKVTHPDGTPYNILTDPEFDLANGAALNLYVAWATADYYGGDEDGVMHGARINDDLTIESIADLTFRDVGYPYRMRLGAIQDVAVENANGSFSVKFFKALPTAFSGDVAFALGGHPALETKDADGVTAFESGATISAVYYPNTPRAAAFDSANCNNCHKRLQMHGNNRNGNYEFCLICHNGDAAVCSDSPEADGSCPVGETQEGYQFGRMIHSIHTASTTFEGGAFAGVTYPNPSVANCETCHTPGSYNVARTTARAVSTNQGSDIRVWTDDIASTTNAAVCGVCHDSTAARGHFESQGGQVDDLKCTIVGAACDNPLGTSGNGLPNGQEACAVCHGTGSEFETSKFHNPGIAAAE